MKANTLAVMVVCIVGVILAITGCEYDGPTAMYNQKQPQTVKPVISGIDPDQHAAAGVNYITILGENFSSVLENNRVYINGIPAEIVDFSPDSIRIYRPDVAADSATIKVVNYESLEYAAYTPYRIDTVMVRYGNFVDNIVANALVVDSEENLYVIQSNNIVSKVTPDGVKQTLPDTALNVVTQAVIHPDGGRMIMMSNDSLITQMVLAGGPATEWASIWILEDSKRKKLSIKVGDFDDAGNLYAAGSKTGIYVVKEGEEGGTALGIYEEDNILFICEHQGYLYLLVNLSGSTSPHDLAIWKHPISSGSLGEADLVFDLAEAQGGFADATINTFEIIQNGKIFIGSNNAAPILIYDPEDNSQEILYKNIIPTQCARLVTGNTNYLYMVLNAASEKNVIRLDIGNLGSL
jgi:hypothetical protein